MRSVVTEVAGETGWQWGHTVASLPVCEPKRPVRWGRCGEGWVEGAPPDHRPRGCLCVAGFY